MRNAKVLPKGIVLGVAMKARARFAIYNYKIWIWNGDAESPLFVGNCFLSLLEVLRSGHECGTYVMMGRGCNEMFHEPRLRPRVEEETYFLMRNILRVVDDPKEMVGRELKL